jgi:hypothetical protein
MHRTRIRIAALLALATLGWGAFLVAAAGAPRLATAGLSVQPDTITFLAEAGAPGVQTRTVQIAGDDTGAPMTWTIGVDPAGALQPTVSPTSGAGAATITVRIDSSPFVAIGAYTGAFSVSSTLGGPATVGVRLIVADSVRRVYVPLVAKDFTPPPPPPPPRPTTTQFGFNFISSAEARSDEARYQRARDAGAGVNRWPFYWDRIEQNPLTQPGVFSWAWQDENTINDINHGLLIDGILLGIPPGLSTGAAQDAPVPRVGQARQFGPGARVAEREGVASVASVPLGLYLSVFSDGTDTPGPGKSINPNNRWARFAHAAAERYRPGGILAQQQGWTNGEGIRVWEVWNEPDLNLFFTGTYTDYARLLKVASLAARHADPYAQILFGGLANFEKPTWLSDTLGVINTYPDRQANGWFFDSVAVHNYAWAWQTFYNVYRARLTLDRFGLTSKSLWLNETGVAICDDFPGPSCTDPLNRTYRANRDEQAAYLIQTATFAVWLKAEAMTYFQLYDDYGNGWCGIEAYGVLRNVPGAGCNASDGSPRPAYAAYQVVTRYLAGVTPYWRRRPTVNQEIIALQNAKTGERVIAMWARDYVSETTAITATAASALMVFPDGSTETIFPVGGWYTLTLPAATNRNTPTTDGKAPIGGMPRILVERDPAIPIIP